jgi:hypothetical protein
VCGDMPPISRRKLVVLCFLRKPGKRLLFYKKLNRGLQCTLCVPVHELSFQSAAENADEESRQEGKTIRMSCMLNEALCCLKSNKVCAQPAQRPGRTFANDAGAG